MNIPSEEKLNEITKKLAEILRIQDWDIDIKTAKPLEMEEIGGYYNDQGAVNIDYIHKFAKVRIGKDSVLDWYKTLFHELLHIQDASFYQYLKSNCDADNDSYLTKIGEQRINELAKSFISIYPVTNFIKDESEAN
jgi:hypothetical protein